MKKLWTLVFVAVIAISGFVVFSGCNKEPEIMVISREKGSGTKSTFDLLIKNDKGESLAVSKEGALDSITETVDLQGSNTDVLTKVATNKAAIGYISKGSLTDDVTPIKINGIQPSRQTVLDGSYPLKRPFIIITNKNIELSPAAADFIKYLKSEDAQKIIGEKLIKPESEGLMPYSPPQSAVSGIVAIAGSTSVNPFMDELMADYKEKGGDMVRDVTLNKDARGSAAAVTAVKNDDSGSKIGMISNDIKPEDESGLDYFTIAIDAIAVIVNNDSKIDNLSVNQLYKIYTGEVKKFSKIH